MTITELIRELENIGDNHGYNTEVRFGNLTDNQGYDFVEFYLSGRIAIFDLKNKK